MTIQPWDLGVIKHRWPLHETRRSLGDVFVSGFLQVGLLGRACSSGSANRSACTTRTHTPIVDPQL